MSIGSLIFGALIIVVAIYIFANADKVSKKMEKGNGEKASTITCRKCGGANINISVSTVPVSTKRNTEVRKKSAVERGFNKTGRGLANLSTLGLYGLFTPKRSDYREVGGDKFNYKQIKTCVCQNCGNSWNI